MLLLVLALGWCARAEPDYLSSLARAETEAEAEVETQQSSSRFLCKRFEQRERARPGELAKRMKPQQPQQPQRNFFAAGLREQQLLASLLESTMMNMKPEQEQQPSQEPAKVKLDLAEPGGQLGGWLQLGRARARPELGANNQKVTRTIQSVFMRLPPRFGKRAPWTEPEVADV